MRASSSVFALRWVAVLGDKVNELPDEGHMPGNAAARPKIVIVTSYPFEDTNAAKARVASFRAALASLGDVHILAPTGSAHVSDPWLTSVEPVAAAHRSFIQRGVAEFRFALKLRRRLIAMKPDVAVLTIPSMFLLVMAGARHCPTIVDIRDLVWDYLPTGTPFQRLAKRALTRWCLYRLGCAMATSVTNETERDRLVAAAATARAPVVIANGISAERFFELSSAIGAKPSETRRRVLYVGNVGIAQDIETLVRAASKLPDLDFTIVGTGNDLPRIRSLLDHLRLSNVELAGGRKWDELLNYYRNADVLYAQIGVEYATAVPSKLAEYMTVGRPVIFGGVGASAAWLSRFSGVRVIPPSDVAALSRALAEVDELSGAIDADANRRLVEENYIRDRQAGALTTLVSEALVGVRD